MSSISSQQNITTTVLTHFQYENRLSVFVNDQIIPLTHVQGVDTVLFPTLLLSDQHIHRHIFSYNNMVFLLKHSHNNTRQFDMSYYLLYNYNLPFYPSNFMINKLIYIKK